MNEEASCSHAAKRRVCSQPFPFAIRSFRTSGQNKFCPYNGVKHVRIWDGTRADLGWNTCEFGVEHVRIWGGTRADLRWNTCGFGMEHVRIWDGTRANLGWKSCEFGVEHVLYFDVQPLYFDVPSNVGT